ncbi:MAG: hypothetical protein JNM24_15100 [Bdellovibrionaceae bacterium]|nr:hypothetical protein [Pseudobdellovibrionaceae bacterium]
MDIIVGLGIFFIFITAIFIAVAFFFPEWLGITGKKAKEVIESHQSETPNDPDTKT